MEIFQIHDELKKNLYYTTPFFEFNDRGLLRFERPFHLDQYIAQKKGCKWRVSKWREKDLDTQMRCFPILTNYFIIDNFYEKVKKRDDRVKGIRKEDEKTGGKITDDIE